MTITEIVFNANTFKNALDEINKQSSINEYTFHFLGKIFYAIGPAWTRSYNDVNLSISYMLEEVQKNKKLTFEKFFAECVSHEIIHSLVRKFGGLEATNKFDNICANKQMKITGGTIDFTIWHGGIPWFD